MAKHKPAMRRDPKGRGSPAKSKARNPKGRGKPRFAHHGSPEKTAANIRSTVGVRILPDRAKVAFDREHERGALDKEQRGKVHKGHHKFVKSLNRSLNRKPKAKAKKKKPPEPSGRRHAKPR